MLYPQGCSSSTSAVAILCFTVILLPLASATTLPAALAFPGQRAFDRVKNDFLALTRRQTSRHILLPKSQDAALALKQKLRNRVDEEGEFVVDAFAAAARRFSLDDSTKDRGGLLGELVPQGYVAASELDRACFEVPLGEVSGPIESEFGYHLVLVSERTGCPRLDGPFTRVVRGKDGRTALAPPAKIKTVQEEVGEFAMDQIPFWIGTESLPNLPPEPLGCWTLCQWRRP